MERGRKWYRRLLAGFFLFMLLCTAVSRIRDSFTVPKVLTVYPMRKSVETVVSGIGTVKENEMTFCPVRPGLKVDSVAVSEGSEVKAGDVLFRFRMSDLLAKKADLETELEESRLELERLDISAETYDQVSQTDLAAREFERAERELEEWQEGYGQRRERHIARLRELEEEYARKSRLADEELLRQQGEQADSVSTELRTALASRDAEVEAARRKIEDLEAEIAANGGGTAATPSDASGLQKQLARAREDLEAVEEQWRIRIQDIRDRRGDLEDEYDRVVNGDTSGQETVRESYEAAVRQEEEAWETQEEKGKELEQSVEQAQWELETAGRRDDYDRLTREQQSRLARIDRRLQEITVSGVKRELAELETLIADEGNVCAPADGTVVLQELVAGRTSTGEERLAIAWGSRIFEAEFDREGQEVSVGDRLSVTIPGSGRSVETVVDGMDLPDGETGVFRADLEDLELPIGTVASYQCRRVSDVYRLVIPLEALRRDANGYYCLAVRSRSAVLGEEFCAERVELTVLCRGSSEAAVEGAISATDEVITAGNRFVGEGSRVRPVEDLGR